MGNPVAYQHPGKLFVEQYGAVTEGSDVLEYANFLRRESNLSDDPPICLDAIFHRFGIVPKRVSLPGQAGLLLNPDSGIIFINEDDPSTRQRFSEAHELIELLFVAQSQPTSGRSLFSEPKKERLCEEGAAELLMPLSTFEPYVNERGVSLETGKWLAQQYDVSLTAALVRSVRFGPGQHALVFWRLAHKPTEERAMPHPNQLCLFQDYAPQTVPKKLRVSWGCSTGNKPFIPRHKSVEPGTSIYEVYDQGVTISAMNWIDFGRTIYGHCFCESMAVTIQEERLVLSVIHLPGDEHSVSGHTMVNG